MIDENNDNGNVNQNNDNLSDKYGYGDSDYRNQANGNEMAQSSGDKETEAVIPDTGNEQGTKAIIENTDKAHNTGAVASDTGGIQEAKDSARADVDAEAVNNISGTSDFHESNNSGGGLNPAEDNYEGLSGLGYNQKESCQTQNPWQAQNINNGYGSNNMSSYYKEKYKKTSNKKSDVWKYVLVSLISAIVGGAIISVMLLVVAPVAQPRLKDFLGVGSQSSNGSSESKSGVSEIKKVEIVQTGESAVTSVAEKVGPSVVGIRTSYQSTNELFGSESDYGEGSGIIISSDGYILTNHHVVENALNDKTRDIKTGSKIQVYLPNKIDKPYVASIKGYDSKTDLAVLKISENNLQAIEFGNSDNLKVGEPAIAFGNPGGLEYMGSLTTGVISGLNRTVQLDGGKKIRLVQTDAAINPGNSGGALVNIKGQLIGVNTIKMVATGFEGLGFAIPVNDAKDIADELIKNTYISKPYLGITVDNSYTEEVAKENNLPMGVFVADVQILGAAQKAGIKALDIITKFNDVSVTSYDELEEEKNKFKPGDAVNVEVYRDGSKKTLKVTLGETK
ncbi:serine protease Do [Ruminiclostridium sufflavum DSM 19573]|uniref:Serine protease Do n=1 Tax=Ruminiclostridium sufflavum DSM 19573 TaxID=1121337 RepID=A0A318XIH9_9FIRM|nr:trypsin-like peptidase domain-containing protein [Ruminiclostridium sufflavum]PYG86834.1 serine protease Do [Ruminiclostridium sufflavum DSM 19573]